MVPNHSPHYYFLRSSPSPPQGHPRKALDNLPHTPRTNLSIDTPCSGRLTYETTLIIEEACGVGIPCVPMPRLAASPARLLRHSPFNEHGGPVV